LLAVVTMQSLSIFHSAWRRLRRARWKSWITTYALVALAWPSLGLLPWIAMESLPHEHAVAHSGASVDSREVSSAHHHEEDASSVPGSPTHPINHDCFQCQVLKHLSRCVLAEPPAPDVSPPPGCAVRTYARVAPQHAGYTALLPPVRGPPLSHA